MLIYNHRVSPEQGAVILVIESRSQPRKAPKSRNVAHEFVLLLTERRQPVGASPHTTASGFKSSSGLKMRRSVNGWIKY